jgi:hypothetical protein
MAEYFNAKEAVVLAKHDTNPLARQPSQILIAAAGNLVFAAQGSPSTGSDITITGAAAGQVYPIRIAYLRSTGTTATVVGLF